MSVPVFALRSNAELFNLALYSGKGLGGGSKEQ